MRGVGGLIQGITEKDLPWRGGLLRGRRGGGGGGLDREGKEDRRKEKGSGMVGRSDKVHSSRLCSMS